MKYSPDELSAAGFTPDIDPLTEAVMEQAKAMMAQTEILRKHASILEAQIGTLQKQHAEMAKQSATAMAAVKAMQETLANRPAYESKVTSRDRDGAIETVVTRPL